jgi:predicted kinase
LQQKNLILLRGLPGSGKTTLAKILAGTQWPSFSVDDFFTDPRTNAYIFRFEDNHLAYKACLSNTEQAMNEQIEKIFIHNTFTLEWEMEPYFQLAKQHNYQIHVATVEHRHQGFNHHGVTPEQLQKMAEKYKVTLF